MSPESHKRLPDGQQTKESAHKFHEINIKLFAETQYLQA